MRLNKANVLRFGRCDCQWHVCLDPTSVHGGRKKKTKSSWNYTGWEEDEDAPRSRKSSASPHSSQRGVAPKNRRKKKKKEQKNLVPDLDPPWTSRDTGSGPSVPTGSGPSRGESQAEQKLNRLVAALEKQENSEEVQQIVDEDANRKASSKQMHSAVSRLDQARSKFQAALKARQNLHKSWSKYLEQSIKRWKTFAEDFSRKSCRRRRRFKKPGNIWTTPKRGCPRETKKRSKM